MNREPTMQDVANLSPAYVWLHRIVVSCTTIMIILAGVFCVIKAASINTIYFLLFMNILISAIMAGLTLLWYKKGHIGMNNHWILLIVGIVVIWQCIATDIYVFNAPAPHSQTNDTFPTTNWTEWTSTTEWTTETMTESFLNKTL